MIKRNYRIVSQGLSDSFVQTNALKINEALHKLGARFYQVCSSLKEKSNKSYFKLTWRRIGNQCFTGDDRITFPNASYISEKVVKEQLRKNFGITLTEIEANPKEAIAKGLQFVKDKLQKAEDKKKPKTKVVKEPKAKVVKEPKAKVVKEPKAKVVKEPKTKVVKSKPEVEVIKNDDNKIEKIVVESSPQSVVSKSNEDLAREGINAIRELLESQIKSKQANAS
jgi:hypothetical protein